MPTSNKTNLPTPRQLLRTLIDEHILKPSYSSTMHKAACRSTFISRSFSLWYSGDVIGPEIRLSPHCSKVREAACTFRLEQT